VAGTRRRPEASPPHRLILDSGAVVALAGHDLRARAVLAAAWEAGAQVVIPSIVLAETLGGSARDAPVNQVITSVGEVAGADAAVGRLAGTLLGTTHSGATVDAVIVASAVALGGGVLLTGDPGDLRPLADGHPEVVVRSL